MMKTPASGSQGFRAMGGTAYTVGHGTRLQAYGVEGERVRKTTAMLGKWTLPPLVLGLLGCGRGQIDLLSDGNFDPDHVVEVHLQMDEADWEELRNESRSFVTEFRGDCRSGPFQNAYTTFHASIEIDGQELSDIGIRKKGFIGSQSTTKPGLKINLDEFIEGAELFGTDNVTLNNAVQDPSLIRQCMGYGVFADAGYPAPRCNFARVSMNGEDLGIYAHVEPIKRSFLRSHFGNDHGDLYEGTLSDFREGWVQTFDVKNSDTDAEMTQIVGLTEALKEEGDLSDRVSPYLDLDQFLSFWALESLTGHWDGYNGNTNNFYVYGDPGAGSLVFLPWGLDDVMDPEALEDEAYSLALLPNRFLQDPSLAARFEDRVWELLDSVWDETVLLAEIDRMEDLIATEIDTSGFEREIDRVRRYVSKRRQKLESTLPGEPVEIREGIGCLEAAGSMEANFEARWNSLDELDGVTDMTLTWDDAPVPLSEAMVGAGISEEGEPLLVFLGVLDPQEEAYVIPYIDFDPEQVRLGEAFAVGEQGSHGGVLYTDRYMGGELSEAGYLFGGALEFESFGDANGDLVRGSLSTDIYAWPSADK